MHGIGGCPFREDSTGISALCIKSRCELWDEYENNCAINVIVKLLRKLDLGA